MKRYTSIVLPLLGLCLVALANYTIWLTHQKKISPVFIAVNVLSFLAVWALFATMCTNPGYTQLKYQY